MKSSPDDVRELKRQLKTLLEDLQTNIAEIGKHTDSASQYAVNKYKEIEKILPKNVLKMRDLKKIKSLYRDVKYISQLKTANLQGAEESYNLFEPVKQRLNLFSKDQVKSEFWDKFDQLYSETPMFEQYKYEVFDIISESMVKGVPTDKILNDILKTFRKTYEELNEKGRYTDEEMELKFSSKLDKLRTKYFSNT